MGWTMEKSWTGLPRKISKIWKHTRIQFCKYIGYVTYINIIFAKLLYNMFWVSHPTRLRIYRLFDLSQLHGTVDLLQDVAPQALATAGLFHWRHEHLQRPGIQQKWCDNPLAQDWNDPHLPTLPLLLGEVCCLQVAYRHCLVAPAASNLQIQKKRRFSWTKKASAAVKAKAQATLAFAGHNLKANMGKKMGTCLLKIIIIIPNIWNNKHEIDMANNNNSYLSHIHVFKRITTSSYFGARD